MSTWIKIGVTRTLRGGRQPGLEDRWSFHECGGRKGFPNREKKKFRQRMGGGAVKGTKVESVNGETVTLAPSREDGGSGEWGWPRVAWVPGGEVTGCPFQGQPGLLAAGGAAEGRDGAALRLLPALGAAAVP